MLAVVVMIARVESLGRFSKVEAGSRVAPRTNAARTEGKGLGS